MRILLSTASGTDKGEGIHFANVLRRQGHDLFEASTPSRELNLNLGKTPAVGFSLGTSIEGLMRLLGHPFDLFLYIEPLGLIPENIHNAPFATACIISDVHRDLGSRLRLAQFFDHVFLYQREYLHHFTEHDALHVDWLPYACDLSVFYPLGITRDIDVAFVGRLVSDERRRIIPRIANHWRMNEQRYYLQREIPEIYSRTKIVVNLPLGDDLNFRVFEAMSCGAMLLTRRAKNGQEVLFQEGVHYAAYAGEQELFDKVDFYLTHETERAAIAAAGLAEIQARHRLEQRTNQLFEKIAAAPDYAAPIRRMTTAQVDRQYAWLYEYWRAPEAGLQLVREARLAGRAWLSLLTPALRSALRVAFR